MERRITIEAVWKEEPDYERLARALLRIAASKQAKSESGKPPTDITEEAA